MDTIDIIFTLLKEKKITLTTFAKEIGVSQGNVSDWKSRKSRPNMDVIPKIAKYFDVTTDFLYSLSDNKKKLSGEQVKIKNDSNEKNLKTFNETQINTDINYCIFCGHKKLNDDNACQNCWEWTGNYKQEKGIAISENFICGAFYYLLHKKTKEKTTVFLKDDEIYNDSENYNFISYEHIVANYPTDTEDKIKKTLLNLSVFFPEGSSYIKYSLKYTCRLLGCLTFSKPEQTKITDTPIRIDGEDGLEDWNNADEEMKKSIREHYWNNAKYDGINFISPKTGQVDGNINEWLRTLLNYGYLQDTADYNYDFSPIISEKGFAKIKEYKNLKQQTVFIAMPFNDYKKETYSYICNNEIKEITVREYTSNETREIIKEILANNNYKAVLVDETPYNTQIPDEILKKIEESHFVVSDLTCCNNNVYYETGYAVAIRKEKVITVCRDDWFETLNFDLKQKNTIIWKDFPELKEKLDFFIKKLFNNDIEKATTNETETRLDKLEKEPEYITRSEIGDIVAKATEKIAEEAVKKQLPDSGMETAGEILPAIAVNQG